MQGQRTSITTLPENITFDHGSASADPLDSPMPWNNIHTSSQNRLPDYRMSSTETSLQYLHHVRNERQNANWSLGESSSSSAQNQVEQNDTKTEHPWSFRSRSSLTFSERNYEPSDVNANDNQTTNGTFILQNSSSENLPQDLNMSSGFGSHEDEDDDDDCQIVERPNSYVLSGSSNDKRPFTGSTSGSFSGFVVDESEDRPRISCKRKALEVHAGQSSGAGSSSSSHNPERNQWHDIPSSEISTNDFSMSTQTENELVINNGPEQANPRLRLGVGGSVSPSPFSLTSSSESSRRNFRLRINGLHQQDVTAGNSNPFSTEADAVNTDAPSSRHSSRLVLRNRLFDLNPSPVEENGGSQGPPVLHVPSVRRNPHSRWSGASSSRNGSSSASGERDASLYEEPSARTIPRSISEHPMFVTASEVGSSSQNPTNWNLSHGNNNVAGNIASSSRVGSSSSWSHRNCPQYPRRLSEIVRRSLLSSAAGTESGGPSSNQAIRASSSSPSPESAIASGGGSDGNGHHSPSSRLALLERHLDGAFGIPYSLRTLAAAGEGRSSIMSEIRHVLDLMRRGEGLRFEDVMILDHSVLFGMADIHDRHRDMRLDVDNMSYEELLALEERIGNVCTGLTEETIMNCLKQHKYVDKKTGDEVETEPCSICREEYVDGEDLGTLECGHDFHRDCIKQWLMHKNLCPICKTTGLNTT